MWSVVLGFLGGVLVSNGIPHFVKGILFEEYPCVFGNRPLINVIAGWVGIVLGALLILAAGLTAGSGIAIALGVLVMGVFHATGGAFRMNDRTGRANPAPR